MSPLVLLSILLPDLVTVTPGLGVIPLSGASRSVDILFRNISEADLTNVRLEVRAEDCSTRVDPEVIPVVAPADRIPFTVTVGRSGRTPNKRFPLVLTFSSDGHPNLKSFRLLVDASAVQHRREDGWIDVGVVTIASRSPAARTWALALLSLIPVAGLLLLGWWLKKRARTNGVKM